MVRVGTTADFVPATGHDEAGLRVLRVRPGDGEWTGEPLSVWCVRARLRSNRLLLSKRTPFACLFVRSRSFVCLFVCSFVRSFVSSFVCSFVRSLVRSLVRSDIRSFVRPFARLFVR